MRREERQRVVLVTAQQGWEEGRSLSRLSGRSLALDGSLGAEASREGRRCDALPWRTANPPEPSEYPTMEVGAGVPLTSGLKLDSYQVNDRIRQKYKNGVSGRKLVRSLKLHDAYRWNIRPQL